METQIYSQILSNFAVPLLIVFFLKTLICETYFVPAHCRISLKRLSSSSTLYKWTPKLITIVFWDYQLERKKLKSSYEVLRDDKARKLFDELLRVRREKHYRERQFEAKRQRMVSDLEKRERESFCAPDPERKAKEEEERIKRKLQQEIARIRAMHAKTKMPGQKEEVKHKRKKTERASSAGGLTLDKTKVLKITWDKGIGDYSATRLVEAFEEFGQVEDVLIKSSKKKGSALVVMASKEAALAAAGTVCGDLSNPLLLRPLQSSTSNPSVRAQEPVEADAPPVSNVVGAGYQVFENSVLDKLRKAVNPLFAHGAS